MCTCVECAAYGTEIPALVCASKVIASCDGCDRDRRMQARKCASTVIESCAICQGEAVLCRL
eukprot:3690831-Rhodomonas_salina.10